MLKAVPAGGVPEVTIKLFAGPAFAGGLGAVRSSSASDDGDDGAVAGDYMYMEDRLEVLNEDHRGSDGSSVVSSSGESGNFGRQPSSGLGFGLLRKSSSTDSFDTLLASRSQRPKTSSPFKPSWIDEGEGANESPQYVCFLA